jgi:hypothetical protein
MIFRRNFVKKMAKYGYPTRNIEKNCSCSLRYL